MGAESPADVGAVCCWAVLDENTARYLMHQVNSLRFQEALRQLNANAVHLGTLLPPFTEDELFFAVP
jgi:hypothetical protein